MFAGIGFCFLEIAVWTCSTIHFKGSCLCNLGFRMRHPHETAQLEEIQRYNPSWPVMPGGVPLIVGSACTLRKRFKSTHRLHICLRVIVSRWFPSKTLRWASRSFIFFKPPSRFSQQVEIYPHAWGQVIYEFWQRIRVKRRVNFYAVSADARNLRRF